MAISIKKYVDITSGLGGVSVAQRRELIGRLFTNNILVPTGSFIEFDSAQEVGDYFGTSSAEYLRAVFYFGFISKTVSRADKISFARWVDADSAARIFGDQQTNNLTDWQAITDGSFGLSIGGITVEVSGLDFNAAASFADVATVIQAGVQAADADPLFSSATVTFNAVKGSYDLVAGTSAIAVIGVSAGTTGTNIQSSMGWSSPVLSDGALAQEPVDAFNESNSGNDNFGSFDFINAITIEQITAVAESNQTLNVKYIYCVGVLDADRATYNTALDNISGVALTLLSDTVTEYDEMVPMIILAATDYNERNATQNYMYQFFDLTPKVSETSVSNELDAEFINYYGETQQAGKSIAFYQRGYMKGSGNEIRNQNVYGNEIWFKDAATTALLNLQLALPKVPANDTGRAQVASQLQNVPIAEGLNNGVISAGKTLDATQRAFVLSLTEDDLAYLQIESIGYWLNVEIQSEVVNGVTEFIAKYTLIYSKDDVVRAIEGRHILI